MKIFFCASVHGKPKFESEYRLIEIRVKSLGHELVADHIFKNDSVTMETWTTKQHKEFYKLLVDGIKKADAVIAEVSYSSTSVGYLIAMALHAGKPTVVFYSGKEEPNLFRSLEEVNEKFQVIRYHSTQELEKEVPFGIEFILSAQDTRFNFFLTPDLSNYLNWVSKTRKTPRSVYLRDLIEADMEENKLDNE